MGVLDPLALVFAGLYGVLVLFYLWERWRRRVVVPSLLLWETIREDTLRARRFRPDLLFVLQLLLLTCLIAGLARPYVTGANGLQRSGPHIFVLDTSASMQTREARASRFAEARARARDVLQTLADDAEVMLITAGPSPEVALNFTRNHAAVRQALEDAVVTDAAGDLSLALAFAEGARQHSDLPAAVEVFTDVPRSQLPAAVRDRATIFQVGETDDNIGIETLQIFQGRFQDYRHARAYVVVENFAHREGHGFLTVRLQDQVVSRNGFSLAPRETRTFLVHDFPGPGRVVAQLEVSDALAADNTAFGWIRPVEPIRVLVVSAPSPLLDDLRALATSTPELQLSVIDPQHFAAHPVPPADIVIYHQYVPPTLVPGNALFIYPAKDNPLFPVAADATNIEVVDWNSHHPAVESLQPLVATPLQRTRVLAVPAWAETLLTSRSGAREFPLAFAGAPHGQRLACIAFDLESERLLSSDNVNLFLFFMNLLGWLAPEHTVVRTVLTGDVESLTELSAEPIHVVDPHGQSATLPAAQTTLQPLFAGEYRISSDGTSRTVLANFFDPGESDIGRARKEPPVFASPATPDKAAATAPRAEYGTWLYYAAGVLFLLEWAVARRGAES